MTLVLTVLGPGSIWMMADRRLTRGGDVLADLIAKKKQVTVAAYPLVYGRANDPAGSFATIKAFTPELYQWEDELALWYRIELGAEKPATK
jgi:hypothetical protein